MAGTYSQILLHIVFSTKHRQPWITPPVQNRIYEYMGGIVRSQRGILYDIGGVEDHVHLYLRWRPSATISDLLRELKSGSTGWIHDTFPEMHQFKWQDGYSAFSVSKSQEAAVKAYIAGQKEHHKKEDYRSELIRMLTLHEVEFDERYVFD